MVTFVILNYFSIFVIMAAPKGNKNREVWTLEEAESFCDQVLQFVIENEKCRSLATATSKLGQYESLLHYFDVKFNVEFGSIKRAKEIVKGRLIEQGLDGDANPTMAIFILKNNHDMADKVEQKNDTTITGLNLKDLVSFE